MDHKELAHSFVGHMVAHPELLREWKALSSKRGAGKNAGDVAKLIKKHLAVNCTAADVKAMAPHLQSAAKNVAAATGAHTSNIASTFDDVTENIISDGYRR